MLNDAQFNLNLSLMALGPELDDDALDLDEDLEELEDDEDEMDEIEESPTDDPSDSGDEKPSTQKEVAQKDPPKLSSEDKKIFTSGDQLNLL